MMTKEEIIGKLKRENYNITCQRGIIMVNLPEEGHEAAMQDFKKKLVQYGYNSSVGCYIYPKGYKMVQTHDTQDTLTEHTLDDNLVNDDQEDI